MIFQSNIMYIMQYINIQIQNITFLDMIYSTDNITYRKLKERTGILIP